jgi:hypothetical protein
MFSLEGGRNRFLRNGSNHLRNYMSSPNVRVKRIAFLLFSISRFPIQAQRPVVKAGFSSGFI